MADGHIEYAVKDLFEKIDRKLDAISIALDRKVDVDTFHLTYDKLEARVAKNEEAVARFHQWRATGTVLISAAVLAINVGVVLIVKFA